MALLPPLKVETVDGSIKRLDTAQKATDDKDMGQESRKQDSMSAVRECDFQARHPSVAVLGSGLAADEGHAVAAHDEGFVLDSNCRWFA